MTSKKQRFILLVLHLFLTFVDKEILLQEYIEVEFKAFFTIFAGFFELQKNKVILLF